MKPCSVALDAGPKVTPLQARFHVPILTVGRNRFHFRTGILAEISLSRVPETRQSVDGKYLTLYRIPKPGRNPTGFHRD